MEKKNTARSRSAQEHKRRAAVAETRAAIGRIKKAVSDTQGDLAKEKAGTKAPHVPRGWRLKRD